MIGLGRLRHTPRFPELSCPNRSLPSTTVSASMPLKATFADFSPPLTRPNSLKEECIWQHHFKTFEQAKAALSRPGSASTTPNALIRRLTTAHRRSTAPSNNYPKRLDTQGGTTDRSTAASLKISVSYWIAFRRRPGSL
jgi:hypothetical protein